MKSGQRGEWISHSASWEATWVMGIIIRLTKNVRAEKVKVVTLINTSSLGGASSYLPSPPSFAMHPVEHLLPELLEEASGERCLSPCLT